MTDLRTTCIFAFNNLIQIHSGLVTMSDPLPPGSRFIDGKIVVMEEHVEEDMETRVPKIGYGAVIIWSRL